MRDIITKSVARGQLPEDTWSRHRARASRYLVTRAGSTASRAKPAILQPSMAPTRLKFSTHYIG